MIGCKERRRTIAHFHEMALAWSDLRKMARRRNGETRLLKLDDGGRILCFREPTPGLLPEKHLKRDEPVARHKQRWAQISA